VTESDWVSSVLSSINSWDKKHVVVSPDIDGILCASLICHTFDSKIVGAYDGRFLIVFDGFTSLDVKNALWLDHDISQPGIISIGQHLINHSDSDELPLRDSRSFNPNQFYNQTWKNSFKKGNLPEGGFDKYPFGTIHLLVEALNVSTPKRLTEHYHLLAHADGTWAVCNEHVENAKRWKKEMFPLGNSLIDYLISDYTKHEANWYAHKSLIQELSEWVDRSTAASVEAMDIPEWNRFRGNQSVKFNLTHWKKLDSGRPSNWMKKLCGLIDYISEKTNWSVNAPKVISEIHLGQILELGGSSQVLNGEFDNFMIREQIFSHAIVSGGCMRFTKNLLINDNSIISLKHIEIDTLV